MGVVWVGGEMWVWHGCDVGVINAKKTESIKCQVYSLKEDS